MTNQPQDVDPFAGGEKVPSISFKDKPIGTTYTGTVTAPPELAQTLDYNTQEPAFWPSKPGQTPNPKMAVVIQVEIEGETRAIWAVKPSAMFAAISKAKTDAGDGPIKVGGVLAVRLTGETPHPTRSDFNGIKQYAAKYTPPAPTDAFADGGDPWAVQTAAPVAAAPAAQAAPAPQLDAPPW